MSKDMGSPKDFYQPELNETVRSDNLNQNGNTLKNTQP